MFLLASLTIFDPNNVLSLPSPLNELVTFLGDGPTTDEKMRASMGLGMWLYLKGKNLPGKPCPTLGAKTTANPTRGWKVGDPINNFTSKGNVPSWSAVRQRFWKNEALNNAANYSEANLARMRQGLAPQRINPQSGLLESKELHHTPSQRSGGLFDVQPVWPEEHAVVDPFRHTGN